MKMPNSSRRQFLKTAGLTGLGLTMAACVPAAAPGMDGAADEEAVELSLWGWWDIRMDLYRSVADKFAEQNDRITVDGTSASSPLPAAMSKSSTQPSQPARGRT